MRTVSVIRKSEQPEVEALFGISASDVEQVSVRLGESGRLKELRQQAWKIVQELPRPTNQDEAWRRTDPARYPYSRVEPGMAENLPLDSAHAEALQEGPVGGWMINHPGQPESVNLDSALAEAGVIFTDWASAVAHHSDLLSEYLTSVLSMDESWFAALAASMAQSGGLVYVPRGVEIQQPLRSVLWAPGAGRAFFSRYLVVVEEGAALTYEHEYVSPTESSPMFHAGTMEVIVRKGGRLNLSVMQNWGEHVWDVVHKRVRVEQDAQVEWNAAVFGGRTTKEFSDLDLAGEGASGKWSGIYFGQGHQHFDIDTQQNHTAPHTTSDLLYKGALTGSSRCVWQGMISVEKGAQQSDGYQANRNLILSDRARADSIPGLEIQADDVRCTHGATAGQVDKEQVYYLMSRGIPRVEAENLVVEGFFSPALDRVSNEALRYRIKHVIDDKMGQYRADSKA